MTNIIGSAGENVTLLGRQGHSIGPILVELGIDVVAPTFISAIKTKEDSETKLAEFTYELLTTTPLAFNIRLPANSSALLSPGNLFYYLSFQDGAEIIPIMFGTLQLRNS